MVYLYNFVRISIFFEMQILSLNLYKRSELILSMRNRRFDWKVFGIDETGIASFRTVV